nr:hypothetical protein BACY1_30370 [Tenacibaculum mesophilum]
MKKKLLLVLLLIVSLSVKAQKKYTFQFVRPGSGFTGGLFFNGKTETYRYRVYNGNTLLKDSGILTRVIPTTGLEVFDGNIAYEVFDQRPTRVITSWSVSGSSTRCDNDITIGSGDCEVNKTGGLFGQPSVTCTTVRVSNNNVLKVSTNNTFCRKESITLTSNSCIPQQTISWYYSLDNINYKPTFLSTSTTSGNSVILDLKDINIPQSYEGPLYFKGIVSITTGLFEWIESDSNIIIYNIIPCSPELVQQPTSITTSCNYSEDGSFAFSVDRDLVANEKLIATLYYKYTTGYDLATNPQREITNLQAMADGSFGYTWSKDLAPGKYQLKYQTLKGSGGINPTDGSWASIVPSDEFTIGKTSKVDFQVTGSADQNCFMVNDGYIDISATGESDRVFSYQLKKDDVIQVFNGTNWVNYTGNNADNETWFPFTNAKTSRISNLNKGAYSVKVKDSQGCLAKQL